MNLSEIAKYRLVSQQLSGATSKSAVELLEWFGAVQGQEYAISRKGLGFWWFQMNGASICDRH
jgi:hypothetical protein